LMVAECDVGVVKRGRPCRSATIVEDEATRSYGMCCSGMTCIYLAEKWCQMGWMEGTNAGLAGVALVEA
jgi:hypothetical protein